MRLAAFVFTSLFFLGFQAQAQLNTTDQWQVGAVYGPLFVGSIPGITQVLPASGFRLNKGMKYYRPEIAWIQGERTGQTFEIMSISMKNPIQLESNELRPFFLVGLHMAKYSHAAASGKRGNGFHLDAGVDYLVAGDMYLRADLFYGNGPGRQMMFTVSLQFDIGAENSDSVQ